MPTRLRCREGNTLPPLEASVTAAPSLCQAGVGGMESVGGALPGEADLSLSRQG